jgi:integrase
LLILTGLRRSEAAQLQWGDIDLKGRTLTVRDTKNREDHTLPLSDRLLELLKLRA